MPVAWGAGQRTHAETYRLLTLFGDVFERVRADYVEPVTDKDLVENSINGMLTGLDPHSNYMDAKAFRTCRCRPRASSAASASRSPRTTAVIKVISPIDDTPAARAGIKPGDLITAIDGKTVQGLALSDAVDKMRGPPSYQDQPDAPSRRRRQADRRLADRARSSRSR